MEMMVKRAAPKGKDRFNKKAPTLAHLAIQASPRQIAAWRAAWELGPEMSYVGWADPLPMPPTEPCKTCLGGIRFWTELAIPHQGWRCCNCHPAPDTIRIRHWTVGPDFIDAAERDAIADAAPERHPGPAKGEGIWLDEPTTEPKEGDWI